MAGRCGLSLLGRPLMDDYLEFVAARARPNTLLAAAYDLKVFFAVVGKEPAAVTTADVLEFINYAVYSAASGEGVGVARLSGCPRRCGGGGPTRSRSRAGWRPLGRARSVVACGACH